ncbi:MAG: flagellar basal body L-ring protein FlgH [Janthinobacterium lividum]
MINLTIKLAAAAVVLMLGGCLAAVPDSIVQHATSTRPQEPATMPAPSSGAIFQSANFRPMFEDRRARLVGDTITIIITENTTANKTAANGSSKTGSATAAATAIPGVTRGLLSSLNVGASNERKLEDKDTASSGNTFISTITVTVVEVLSNGNMVVSGEKQVAFDRGAEFIRFSGVVNPSNISSTNQIASTQVADARAEYRTNTQIDKAAVYGAMQRLFLSVLPL